MALAIATVKGIENRPVPVGQHREVIVDCTFDSSYPTGGEELLPKALGLSKILHVQHSEDRVAGIKTASYDYTNQKLRLFSPTAEVANASDQSAVIVRLVVKGY